MLELHSKEKKFMDRADYWLLTWQSCTKAPADDHGLCVALNSDIFFYNHIGGWIPKEISSIRDHLVNLLIASYSIRWSIDADLGSFGSFGLAPQKSVHHYGQTKGLSPVSLRSFASYAFYFLRCRFAWEHPADTAVVPCTLDRSLEKRG